MLVIRKSTCLVALLVGLLAGGSQSRAQVQQLPLPSTGEDEVTQLVGWEQNACFPDSLLPASWEPRSDPEWTSIFEDAAFTVRGQSADAAEGGGNLAQQAQNPVANLAAFPLQSNWDFGNGNDDRTRYVGLFQPVVPWKLNDDWNLITRLIVPFLDVPIGATADAHGIGDTFGQFYFSPNTEGKFIWGVGPQVLFPTASDPSLGFGEWGAGVNAVGLISDGPIVAGALISQVWSVEGSTKPFLLQPFLNYNFDKGWFVSVSGEFNADWELPEPARWSIPFGPGFGRTFAIASQPLTISTRFAPYLEAPPGGPDWQFRFAVSLLFPK